MVEELIQFCRVGAVEGIFTWTPEIMGDMSLWVDQRASKSVLPLSMLTTVRTVVMATISFGSMRDTVTVPLTTVY